MKQSIAPALFTQLDLQLDPLAGGSAWADGEPRPSMKSKANPLTRAERTIVAEADIETT
jgi:hypothetical protein